MARQMHKGVYASDILAINFTRRVDDHFFTQAVLSWSVPVGGELPIPTTLRPRHAVGIDAEGFRHSVVVPDTTADVWTRAAAGWQVLDDEGTLIDVVTTGLVGEAITF